MKTTTNTIQSKKKKTLYVSDLDGTLLNNQSCLSANTVNKLNELIQQRGAHFTIATARTPATVANLMKEVHSNLPYIVMAGAALWDNPKQNYQKVRTLHHSVVRQLLDIYERHTVNPFLYRQQGNCIHAHHLPILTPQEKEFIDHRLTSPLKKLFTEEKLEIHEADDTMLVYSMGKYEQLRDIADEIEEKEIPCTQMCYHDIFDPSQGYLEIYAEGTTKAAAIQHLAEEINADRIVVFGDNLNDIPMMQSADYSIAVGNAFNEVKEQADEIISTNEEDAVVHWIESDLAHQTNLHQND